MGILKKRWITFAIEYEISSYLLSIQIICIVLYYYLKYYIYKHISSNNKYKVYIIEIYSIL